MQVAYEKAFNALGDPTRRAIFEKLATGSYAVVDIAKGLPVTRPAVSQHLKVLADAGLVEGYRNGTRNIYRIDNRGIQAMRKYLDRFWDNALVAFQAAAEKEQKKRDRKKV